MMMMMMMMVMVSTISVKLVQASNRLVALPCQFYVWIALLFSRSPLYFTFELLGCSFGVRGISRLGCLVVLEAAVFHARWQPVLDLKSRWGALIVLN